MNLAYTAGAQALDKEATEQWGLNPFALVEAAGRACAKAFVSTIQPSPPAPCSLLPLPHSLLPTPHSLILLAGKGNNAADALIMLKALILDAYVQASDCSVFAVQAPDESGTPLAEAMRAVRKLGVPVPAWDAAQAKAALAASGASGTGVVIDGITGTGLTSPLRNAALEMAEAVNALRHDKNGPCVVSIDMPSGNFDGWQPGMPIVTADITLAIEPQKLCIYTPSSRPHAGVIVPVNGIFPPALMEKYRDARLVAWEDISADIPAVPKTAHKYQRGLVEIRAGSPGAAGAARLAALGAQAAGAGLVRLMVDPSLYPVIAPSCSGIMVVPDGGETGGEGRFSPAAHNASAVLLGPGWGRGDDRMRLLQGYLPLEEKGIPLILDADAIALAKDIVFHGNAILTPHAGEFAAYTGLPAGLILADPVPVLRRFSAEKKVHILFKGHVLYVVSPDGRLAVIDGMNPLLAAGGTGDVLAGFCASLAARGRDDLWQCACAAASLLIRTAESESIAGRFIDPGELAHAAASIAGAAWLDTTKYQELP